MKSCVPLFTLYTKVVGPYSTNGGYVNQEYAISPPVPQGLVWLVQQIDGLQSCKPGVNVLVTRPITGYLVPPQQKGPQLSAGANPADLTFFGDYEGVPGGQSPGADGPSAPSAARPPIVDAIRLDWDDVGSRSTSYIMGEAKNLRSFQRFVIMPEYWRLAVYTGLYDNSPQIGSNFLMRFNYFQLTIDQANQLLNS